MILKAWYLNLSEMVEYSKSSMRNLKARLTRLEAKKPPVKRTVRIYWADGTFVGEMIY